MKFKQFKPFTKDSSTGYKKDQKGGLDVKEKFENNKDSRGVQCHECSGYSHIKSECTNTIKKKNRKGYQVAWDDDSDDSNTKSETAHFTALMAGSDSHEISSHHSSVELYDTLSSEENKSDQKGEFNFLQEAYDSLSHDTLLLKKKEVKLKNQIVKL